MKKITRKNSTAKKQEFSQALMDNDHYELHSTAPNRNGNSNANSRTIAGNGNKIQFESNPMNRSVPQHQTVYPPSSQNGQNSADPADFRSFFLPEEGYQWDFCIVLPNPEFYRKKHDEEDEEARAAGRALPSDTRTEFNSNHVPYREIVERLYLAGLQTYSFLSGDADEIFVKIRAPLQKLKDHATSVGLTMLYDPTYLKKCVDNQQHPIADDPEITTLTPYQFIYGPFDEGNRFLFFSFFLFFLLFTLFLCVSVHRKT
jgi:hypothetical protein